jgi:hypothetical protein
MKTIGIALGPDRLVALLPGGRRLETTEAADLARALAELKETTGLAQARVSVALLPPLVELRRVTLPPLRADERRRVLARDVARYFIGVREPQVVSSEAPLAAAAPARLIDDVEAAVAGVGWVLGGVVPAHVAWAAKARDGRVAAPLPHATEVLRVEQGRVVERGRLRPGEADPNATEIDPYAVAAEYAPRVHALDLCSDERRKVRGRRAGRIARTLVTGAAACVLAAAGLDYWGLGRELATVRERRAALAPQVSAAMRTRDSLGTVAGVVATLGTLEATSPRWSTFLTDLADYLPRDAHLVAVRAVGDSVAAVGIAREAAGVFEGLARMPHLAGVRADGPIRQEVAPSGVVREHFGLSARWGWGGGSP